MPDTTPEDAPRSRARSHDSAGGLRTCGPVYDYVRDKMEVLGWTKQDLAERMGGKVWWNRFALSLLELRDPQMTLGDVMAEKLERAFGTSREEWLRIDEAWRSNPTVRRDSE